MAGPLAPGERASLHTHTGHTFVARAHAPDTPAFGDASGSAKSKARTFAVTAGAGEEQDFHFDEL